MEQAPIPAGNSVFGSLASVPPGTCGSIRRWAIAEMPSKPEISM